VPLASDIGTNVGALSRIACSPVWITPTDPGERELGPRELAAPKGCPTPELDSGGIVDTGPAMDAVQYLHQAPRLIVLRLSTSHSPGAKNEFR
jgi:hypothetical protein